MKKVILAVVVLALSISVSAFAEETKKEEMPGMSTDKPVGISTMGMGKMCSPAMDKTQMVATDEGGVIVLTGNKLMKYDTDLNLVKETEVKMPMDPAGDKQCPMMGKMTGQAAAPVAAESQEKAAS